MYWNQQMTILHTSVHTIYCGQTQSSGLNQTWVDPIFECCLRPKIDCNWGNFQISTGCVRQNENPTNFKIVKELLLVQNHRIHQQKALDFSFNLKPWKWAWHDQEGVTPSRPPKPFFTSRAPTLFAARGRGALLIMPRPLSGSQMKAEIQGFLLMYCMILC